MLLSLQQATMTSDDSGPRAQYPGHVITLDQSESSITEDSRGQTRNTSEAGNFDCEVTTEVSSSPGTGEDAGRGWEARHRITVIKLYEGGGSSNPGQFYNVSILYISNDYTLVIK